MQCKSQGLLKYRLCKQDFENVYYIASSCHTIHHTSLSSLPLLKISLKRLPLVLNLAWFQEAQNFICDAGKISLHGKGPNGKSNDSIFPKESCHLRPCPYRRSSEQLIPCIKCVCACIW